MDPSVRPVAEDALEEHDGWLLVPASGHRLTDEDVRELRDPDERRGRRGAAGRRDRPF